MTAIVLLGFLLIKDLSVLLNNEDEGILSKQEASCYWYYWVSRESFVGENSLQLARSRDCVRFDQGKKRFTFTLKI